MGRKIKEKFKEPFVNKPPVEPKTPKQKEYIEAIRTKPVVLVTGYAGTGKTMIPACYAAHWLALGQIERIVLTRPTVPVSKSIGFLPGDLHDKLEPWVQPILSYMGDYLGKDKTEALLKTGAIEIIPFEVIRGRTFENAFVILDEAQNATYEEVKAFVTRIGENSTVVVNGDVTQSDIRRNGTALSQKNGLAHLVEVVLRDTDLGRSVALVEFEIRDIVRSKLCREFVQAFQKYERELE